jgi:uncharacterized protein YecT (DUF1311 family)
VAAFVRSQIIDKTAHLRLTYRLVELRRPLTQTKDPTVVKIISEGIAHFEKRLRTARSAPLIIVIAIGMCWSSSLWAAEDPAETACGQKDTTVAISQCLADQMPNWDARLNRAYKAAMAASDNDARKTSLVKAERAWLAYRTENCGWYGAQEGTIRQIAGAHCMLSMTRERTIELENAVQP